MAHSLIRFTKRHTMYNVGEVAGFNPATARDLVENRQVADYHVAQVQPAQVRTEAPAVPPIDKAVRAPKVRK